MLNFVREMWDFCREQKPYIGLIEVDREKLRAFAAELTEKFDKGELKVPDWKRPGVYPETDHAFANHSFWHSVVNFCYLDPENPKQKFQIGQFTGADAMCHCFTRMFGENLIWPEDIGQIADSPAAMENFFQGDTPLPLLEERRKNLLEAAFILEAKFDGRPEEIMHEAGYRADKIIMTLLSEFPTSLGGDWVYRYGRRLVFAKRAQLWPLVYQGRAFNSQGLHWLSGYEEIGPIVDYQVPNGLRHRGIHRYAKDLAEKIDNKVPLLKQGEEELAVRFATAETLLDLQEIMMEGVRCRTMPFTQVELDFPLWWEGRMAFKNGMNHMLVKTTDY